MSVCQTVWLQIRADMSVLIQVQTVGPDLHPNCLQRLSADDKSPLANLQELMINFVS